jgi:autotransporter-associated beta strand protein
VNPNASSWSIGSNWSSDPLFPGAGGVASFAGFVGSDVTDTPIVVDVPIELSALRLTTLSRVFLTGGELTFTGPAELNVTASPVYTIDSPSQPGVLFRPDDGHLIASVIAGSNGLVKTGGGMVRLTATNTFTGGLTISGGTVVASNAALGGAAGGVTLNGGSLRIQPSAESIDRSMVLTVAGGTLSLDGSTWGGVISGSGPLTVVLPALNDLVPPVLGPAFTGNNSFSGALNIIGGINAQPLRLKDAGGAFDTSSVELNGGWIDLDNSGAANSNRLSDNAEISINDGTINLIANAITPVNEQFGTLTLRGGTSHVTVQDAADAITVSAIQRTNRGLGVFSGRVFAGNGAALLVGGGGAAGSTNMSIIPFAVGGGNVYTYEAATGIRPLAPNEYVSTLPPGGSVTTDNVRLDNSVNVTSAVTVNSLSFANDNNVISGSGTITITSGLLTSGPGANIILSPINFGTSEGIITAPPFNVGALPINGPISGSAGLTIGDGGAELSSLLSNYTGITTVNGLLRLSENVPASGTGPLGASTSAVVLVGPGAEIFNSGVQGIFARDLVVKAVGVTNHSAVATITNMNITGDVQLDQWVRATGTIAGDISGPGGINIAATAGSLRLSGNNTFTGGIEIGAGRLNIAGDNATGNGVIYLGGTRDSSTAGRLAAIDAPRTISNRIVVTGPINFNVGTFPLTMAGEFDLNGNLGTTSNYSMRNPRQRQHHSPARRKRPWARVGAAFHHPGRRHLAIVRRHFHSQSCAEPRRHAAKCLGKQYLERKRQPHRHRLDSGRRRYADDRRQRLQYRQPVADRWCWNAGRGELSPWINVFCDRRAGSGGAQRNRQRYEQGHCTEHRQQRSVGSYRQRFGD